MKSKLFIPMALAAAVCVAFGSCKTTEANYRAAYERAIAGRDSAATAFNETIYGAVRNANSHDVVVAGDTAEMQVQRVIVTQGQGNAADLRSYNIVVGQFKLLFNASSMRQRLVDAGYATTMVVETAEPYYYVVLSSHDEIGAAMKAIRGIPSDFPIAMREPLPFILHVPTRGVQ